MKNILLNLIAFLLLMQLSCGKESKPYDPFPDNEVKATITVDGAAPILCESKGNATLFVKRTETSGPLITVVDVRKYRSISKTFLAQAPTFWTLPYQLHQTLLPGVNI